MKWWLLFLRSAASRNLHELRPYKGFVWFKGGLDVGEWRGRFYSTDNAEYEEALMLQHGDLTDCVVSEWRMTTKDPIDMKNAPPTPEAAKWKFNC